MEENSEVVWHHGAVCREDRERQTGHRGVTLWFTGLPASGKSTLAVETETALHNKGCHTYILDGDNIRHGLNKNLGFSPGDRTENIRRIAEVSNLFGDCGVISLTAFISPYRSDRYMARQVCGDDRFIEIFVDCPIEICEQRDPKGMYQKARAGVLKAFTGVSAPYEPPGDPDIHLRTDRMPIAACVDTIVAYLSKKNYLFYPVFPQVGANGEMSAQGLA